MNKILVQIFCSEPVFLNSVNMCWNDFASLSKTPGQQSWSIPVDTAVLQERRRGWRRTRRPSQQAEPPVPRQPWCRPPPADCPSSARSSSKPRSTMSSALRPVSLPTTRVSSVDKT